MNVRFDFIESKSDWLIFAFVAATSTFTGWAEICGSYFVAWVRTLKTTFVGCSGVFLISFVAASLAYIPRVNSSVSAHGVVPVLYSPTFPVTRMFLGASTSTLSVRGTPLWVNPGNPNPLDVLPFVSLNIACTNFPELSVTTPILRSVSSVGVTYTTCLLSASTTFSFPSGVNVNTGGSVSPTLEFSLVVSLSTLSVVTDLAVTSVASLIARSLIVTTPVSGSIVTPSPGAPLVNDHLFPFLVAVTVIVESFGCL